MAFIVINIIASIIVLIGSINWGLVGIFNWNLVSAIFGAMPLGSTIVYVLVLLAALWLVFATFYQKGKIIYNKHDVTSSGKDNRY